MDQMKSLINTVCLVYKKVADVRYRIVLDPFYKPFPPERKHPRPTRTPALDLSFQAICSHSNELNHNSGCLTCFRNQIGQQISCNKVICLLSAFIERIVDQLSFHNLYYMAESPDNKAMNDLLLCDLPSVIVNR